MKKIQIQVPFEEEKFSALKLYLDQKGVLVDDALAQMVESLYEKTVPAGVRDYINLRAGITDTPPAKKRRTKSEASVSDVEAECAADEVKADLGN